ncbi:hypothetical protein YC2023_044654 [Brassica napus]
MDIDFPTFILRQYFATRYIFELDFLCHRFEVNQHHVAEVMPVLLKSGQSASQEEAVEEMKDCRSMKQNWERKEELFQSLPGTPLAFIISIALARRIVDRQLGSCIDRRSERCINKQLVDSVNRHFLKINMQENPKSSNHPSIKPQSINRAINLLTNLLFTFKIIKST